MIVPKLNLKNQRLKAVNPNGKSKYPKPPTGREWTETEKANYYNDFQKSWSSWKNQVLGILHKNGKLSMDQHSQNATKIDDIMDMLHSMYKSGISPEDASTRI